MNFFTNEISHPAGYDGPSFEEWVANEIVKLAEKDKTASEAKPGLGMAEDGDSRNQDRGQVINNDNEEGANSYQEGESVSGKADQAEGKSESKAAESEEKVVEAECGKEMGESDNAGKVTEDHTEAAPGDDNNKDCKTLINNDPNYQKGESTDPAKLDNKKGPNDKAASASPRFKKVASMNRNEKLELFATLSSNKNNPIEYVEAMTGLKFANLSEEEKSWFKNFWQVLYPPEYVEEMVADR